MRCMSTSTRAEATTTATPLTIWLTGLSGSGKSTLAQGLAERFAREGVLHFILDGDAVRTGLCRDLGFSAADRKENIRRVAEVAALMNRAGLTVICALISPLLEDRRMAREIIGHGRFVEVHVATSLEVCEQRDPKGLYRRARAGAIPDFTGISAPYEVPVAAELVIDTALLGVDEAVGKVHGAWVGRQRLAG
jgi:adenylylsulfate kinase